MFLFYGELPLSPFVMFLTNQFCLVETYLFCTTTTYFFFYLRAYLTDELRTWYLYYSATTVLLRTANTLIVLYLVPTTGTWYSVCPRFSKMEGEKKIEKNIIFYF